MRKQKDREAVHRIAKDGMTIAIALMFFALAMAGFFLALERQLSHVARINQERVQW